MKSPTERIQQDLPKPKKVSEVAKSEAVSSAAPDNGNIAASVESTVPSNQDTKHEILGAHLNEAIDYASHSGDDKSAVKALVLDLATIANKAVKAVGNASSVSNDAKDISNKKIDITVDVDRKANDTIRTSQAKNDDAVVRGSNRDDVLTGNKKNNQIDGGNGDDRIFGGDGDDKLIGGNGDDYLDGGDGDDILSGGNGNDYLVGGAGNDTLNGGNGDDVLVAGSGRNLLIGGNGEDLYLFTKDSLGTGMTSTNLMVDGSDTIDLSQLRLHQAEGNAFTGKAGEMLIQRTGSVTTLLGDVDGDGKADIEVNVMGAGDSIADILVLAPAPAKPAPVDAAPVEPAPVEPAPVDPVEPEPVDPAPVDPTPVDPAPVEPEPMDPDPVDPIPGDPAPVDPVDPDPLDPAPVDPAPVDPTPVDPAPVEPAPEPVRADGFKASWYVTRKTVNRLSDVDFNAEPANVGALESISFKSGSASFWEGGPSDHFAARIVGNLAIEKAGTYTFYLKSDDGSAFSLGGVKAIDNDGAHASREKTVTLTLEAGAIPLEVIYFERNGGQVLELSWSGPDTGGKRLPLNSEHVSHAVDAPATPQPEPEPQPDPVDPAPVDPAPVDPDPVDPAPVEPAPVDPTPIDPEPGQPIQAVMTATAQEDRVAQLEIPDSVTNGQQISSIRILEQPETGHVSVSPENGITLVMTEAQKGFAQIGFTYEVTLEDSTVVRVEADVDLTAAQQAGGWGLGENYMLETNVKGDLVIEHGENHRKVFVTGGDHALSKEDIATMEGTTVEAIAMTKGGWGAWLEKNPEYGASEDMALNTELGMALWQTTTQYKTTSNWLLFERGYEYPQASRLIMRGSNGESELNPVVVTAYGEGEAPVIGGKLNIYQTLSSNVAITGVNLDGGAQALGAKNLLINDSIVKGGNFQSVDGLTIRNSDFIDIIREAPANTGDTWSPHINRTQGVFISKSEGIRLEGNLFDKNGWVEGYDYNLAITAPQPPSMYSQNVYIQYDNFDVTLVDNIIMRGASFGSQVRSGGFVEDNVYIDNNAAVNAAGGNRSDSGEALGNYTLFNGNVITSAGHKRVSAGEGALSMGIDEFAKQSSLIENIIAHLADPANAAEISQKFVTHAALNSNASRFFDDTIVYRWTGSKPSSRNPDRNVEDLDKAVLNETTIQRFASELLGKEGATISDLAAFLRAQARGEFDDVVDADMIIAFFREGFGLDISPRTVTETLVFAPDERGDGARWDNRLNWSTNDLPGTRNGDSVDLAGNSVRFGSYTVAVDNFDFGDFGKLAATSGKLSIDGDISVGDMGASLSVDRAGQVWIDGYRDSDMLEINVAGGRFANTGNMVGKIDIDVSDNAQALLALPGGSFDLMGGSNLSIVGNQVKVGFDGQNGGNGVLRMHNGATLSFTADAAGLSTLGEFRSGVFGTTPKIDTAVRIDGNLQIDVAAWYASGNSAAETLIKADQIVGIFDSIEVVGLTRDRNATIIIDYNADELRFVMGPADGLGEGAVSTIIVGAELSEEWSEDAGMRDLWQALHEPILSPIDDPLSY